MDWETVLQSIDELVFNQTRKHLDSLQVEILRGVFNGQKYPEIAKKYKCSKGHVKDEAYKGKCCQRVLGKMSIGRFFAPPLNG